MSFEEKTTNLNPLDPRMFLSSMVKVGPVVLNKFFKIVHEALLLNKHGFPNQEVMLKL